MLHYIALVKLFQSFIHSNYTSTIFRLKLTLYVFIIYKKKQIISVRNLLDSYRRHYNKNIVNILRSDNLISNSVQHDYNIMIINLFPFHRVFLKTAEILCNQQRRRRNSKTLKRRYSIIENIFQAACLSRHQTSFEKKNSIYSIRKIVLGLVKLSTSVSWN